MKPAKVPALVLLIGSAFTLSATVRYVDLNNPQPAPPYTDWASAATNIQDAVDASADGDLIWVTNGVYASGGRAIVSGMTNRVTLDRGVTVQSVNGPLVTIIQGGGAFNGPNAIRCAWLTNSAVLQGFTLRSGATQTGGSMATISGGGAWCASSNAIIMNCIISSNTAGVYGGGAYQGALRNCALVGNLAGSGSATFGCLLYNCTACSNYQSTAVFGGALTNCVVYANSIANYGSATLAYCCSTPLPSGPGNISANPQLLSDNIHLTSTSPCRGAGLSLAAGTDIDGQPWANPPSIGCDEWQPAPIVAGSPKIQLTSDPVGFTVSVSVAGQDPFTCWWLRNGTAVENDGHFSYAHTTNLVATGVGPLDGGSYQLIASNAWGMATSGVARLVFHYADVASTNPIAPYLDWPTAASTIQDAIDSAQPGEVVMVTNGVYASGGKPWGGALTNRIVLNKALLVQSVNGPTSTIIPGASDPASTNGLLAVRCAWLTNAATLSGFTLRGGATLAWTGTGSGNDQSGGGIFGSATNFNRAPSPIVANSIIANNTGVYGGGAYQAVLLNCTITGNSALQANAGVGGGADSCTLKNCLVSGNWANWSGGGTAGSLLMNCAVLKNSAVTWGGGVSSGSLVNCTLSGNVVGTANINGGAGGAYTANLTNCIVFWNQKIRSGALTNNNYDPGFAGTFSYSCTYPLPAGTGNISADPQLLPDGVHVLSTSPCRGAGLAGAVIGTDIDGQPWAGTPSMGCDEWSPAPVATFAPQFLATGAPAGLTASEVVAGQPPFSLWWVKDSVLLDDNAHYGSSHTTNLVVRNFGPADAGGYQLIASNAFGMVTSALAQVVVHCADPSSLSPSAPFSDWSVAATNLQDAVDAAAVGDFVLATNGLYNSGGRPVGGGVTNRVTIQRPITVVSVNGPAATTISGVWDPALTNGPAAIRGVWLADGATLNGFTVENGATGGNDYGGGVYAASTNAYVVNCVLSNNQAGLSGGGCYQGLLTSCRLVGNQTVNQGGAACQSLIFNSLLHRNWARNGGGATYYCVIFNSTLSSNTTSLYGGASYQDTLYNCLITNNTAGNAGGGAYQSSLGNCTVIGNYAGIFGGGGSYLGSARNSIIYFNNASGSVSSWNYFSGGLTYCCTTPLPGGAGNITANPQLLDGIHISTISPCRGAGSATYATGTDIDGEPWASPPSIGCDEVWEAALTGPLAVSITPRYTTVAQYGQDGLFGQVIGQASRVAWDFGDGTGLTNISSVGYPKVWTNPGDYTVTFTAYNTDNPTGVWANALIHVVPLVSPSVSTFGLTGQTFTVGFVGQPGVNYVVDAATNLAPPVVWNPVWYVVGTGANVQGIDYQATGAAKFYRVRSQPWPPPPF